MSILTKGLAKLFGSKSDRDIKEVTPYVEEINKIYTSLAGLSDDELRGKTEELKTRIATDLKSIDDQIAELHDKIQNQPDLDIQEKEATFEAIDKL